MAHFPTTIWQFPAVYFTSVIEAMARTEVWEKNWMARNTKRSIPHRRSQCACVEHVSVVRHSRWRRRWNSDFALASLFQFFLPVAALRYVKLVVLSATGTFRWEFTIHWLGFSNGSLTEHWTVNFAISTTELSFNCRLLLTNYLKNNKK